MLQTKVKASSITNLTDARYFAAFEVEWLGFQLDPGSERYVQPQIAQAIREWVDGVKIVGEFGLQSAREIQTASDLLRLDAIQVGMFSEMETLAEINRSLPVIKEVVIESTTTAHELIEHLETFASSCAYFLLNFDKNSIAWKDLKNDLSAINFNSLQSICSVYPVLLSLDFTPATLLEAVDLLAPAGFNFTGGEEEKTGYKSFDELDELLEVLIIEV